MKAIQLVAKDTVVFVDNAPMPTVGPGEVMMKVHYAGICGTDLSVMHSGGRGKLPLTMSHEFVGEAVELGPGVEGFSVGDRIAAVPITTDGTCYHCQHGRFHVCDIRKVHGIEIDGGMAEYVTVQARHTFKIPDHVPFREAVAIEPVGNIVHAIDRSRVAAGDSVVQIGDGFHGLTLTRIAKLKGAGPIVFCGHHPERFPIAMHYGADVCIDTSQEDPVAKVREMFADQGHGVDMVMDSTDSVSALEQAVGVARKGARLLLFSSPRHIAEPYWQQMRFKELDVYPSHSWPHVFPEAIRLIASGDLDVRPMLTHYIPLEEGVRAFEIADKRLDHSIRVVVEVIPD